MGCSRALLDRHRLVSLSYSSALPCHTWQVESTSHQRYDWNLFGRRRLSHCIGDDAPRFANAQKAFDMREQFGPFQPWFFLGVAAVEIVMMTAFGYAVIKSILHRKNLEDHAWWLISTVFLIMMPALGRGIQIVYVGIYSADWPNIDIMMPIYFTQVVIIGMLLFAAWKYEKLKHPATFLGVGVNLFIFLTEPLGRSESVQEFLKTFIKG
jgi:hypothetical protein